MKLTTKKNELIKAMHLITGVLPKKNIKPILSGVKITIGEEVYLEATDMESSIRITLPCSELEGTGEAVVDASTIADVAKNLLNDEVTLDLTENKAIAHTGTGQIKIPVMNAEDYPDLDFAGVGEPITVDTSMLSDMIGDVLFCASKDEMVRNLNGVLWEFEQNCLRLVTADSYRLAVTERMVTKRETPLSFYVSLKGMKEISKIITGDSVDVRYDGVKVWIAADNFLFAVRQMDVSFPNYKGILPNSFQTAFTVDRKNLLDSLKLLSVVAKKEGDTVIFVADNDVVEIQAKSTDTGAGTMMLDTKHEGKKIRTAFDPRFLIEGLAKFDETDIKLQFVDADNAMQISNDDFLHIIMPVKIKD